jgi:ribonuclease Y
VNIAIVVVIAAAALGLGLGVGLLIRRTVSKKAVEEAQSQASHIVKEAEQSARAMKKEAELEAKDAQLKARSEFEKDVQEKQKELQNLEKRLQTKEDNLEKKFNLIEAKEDEFRSQEQSIADRKKHIEGLEKRYMDLVAETRKALEKVAGLSSEDAKRQLKESLIEDAKNEAARTIKDIEDKTKEEAQKKGRYIMATAIERMASDYVAERSISVVQLPGDEMKGRIIGREGRNIRALEAATGIDIVIDDTPEAVILSGFNPVRREVARISLENLIADGRIHPTRIEEMVAKVTQEVDEQIKETGEQTCLDLDIHNVHPELIKLLGALKYRYSFAQNVLQHSIEVSYMAGMMAAELGMDEAIARRAGLLHDIGKAVSHEVEGSHALIGMEYAKKYRETPEVVHSIGAHHEDLQQESALDCIIDAADALSGARPGARREVLEAYVKRIEDLERISNSFGGVEKSYAIQAGREIRVMVVNEEVDDAQASVLSKDIAKKIEEEMTYPGQIKVTVIRETRATEYAK